MSDIIKRNWFNELGDGEEIAIFKKIVHILQNCICNLNANSSEDHITYYLVEELNKDVLSIEDGLFHQIECQKPTKERNEDDEILDGKADIAIIVDRKQKFFAVETKKLNVKDKYGKSIVQGDKYVKDGLNRFVEGKYTPKRQLGFMLGYVMGGDIEKVRKSVKGSIKHKNHESWISLIAGPIDIDSIGDAVRFYTKHERANNLGPIDVRHILVPLYTY